MIEPEVRSEILKRLKTAEAEHQVSILYACESGSRAWGFASPNFDYDVLRFMLIAIGDAKAVDPASEILAGFEQLLAHGYIPVPVRQFANGLLKLMTGFRVPLNATAPAGASEELAVVGADDLAFGVSLH